MRASRLLIVLLVFSLCSPAAFAQARGKAAFLKSLVIPGWGQYELERPRHALAFFATDLLLLGSALSLSSYGNSVRNDYEAFAAAHAGVSGGHDKDFYADVGNWMSVYDYNEQRMADRNYAAAYDTESQYWLWDSDRNRVSMDEMRVKSERALNRVIYAVALMGVNHLVSAFHAGRLQQSPKKQSTLDVKPGSHEFDLALQPIATSSALGFSLSATWYMQDALPRLANRSVRLSWLQLRFIPWQF